MPERPGRLYIGSRALLHPPVPALHPAIMRSMRCLEVAPRPEHRRFERFLLLYQGPDRHVRPVDAVEVEHHQLGVLKLELVGVAAGAGDRLDPEDGLHLCGPCVANGSGCPLSRSETRYSRSRRPP